MKALYIDNRGTAEEIEHVKNLLRSNKVDFDSATIPENVEQMLETKYLPNIQKYDLLIEHYANENENHPTFLPLLDLLKNNPSLNILRVSSQKEDISFNERDIDFLKQQGIEPGRIQVGRYASGETAKNIQKWSR